MKKKRNQTAEIKAKGLYPVRLDLPGEIAHSIENYMELFDMKKKPLLEKILIRVCELPEHEGIELLFKLFYPDRTQ